MRQIVLFVLAAFAVGCLQVQRLPDGSANYGGITSATGAMRLNTSGAVMTAVREAARSGQPVSAMFDGQGGGSVQVGYAYGGGYGVYPATYGYDPQFAASAARSAQVWAEQLAAERPIPVGSIRGGDVESRLTSLEETQAEELETVRRSAAKRQ